MIVHRHHTPSIGIVLFTFASMVGCGTTTAPSDASTDGAEPDAGHDGGADVVIPPCHVADAGYPPDATASELAGAGDCCAATMDCKLNTAICVSGRCCISIQDTGRRCHANSDCCSLQCSCGDACDPSSAGGGTCAPYP